MVGCHATLKTGPCHLPLATCHIYKTDAVRMEGLQALKRMCAYHISRTWNISVATGYVYYLLLYWLRLRTETSAHKRTKKIH